MKKYPAIATLEFKDIAVGMHTTDALIKKAPISLVKCGTISHGRYLTLIAGSTASVEESYHEALYWAKDNLIDHVFLPDIASTLHDAVFGKRAPCKDGAIGIVETATTSCNIRASELALKGTTVDLIELRLADSLLHGKGVSIFNGELHDIEAAMDIVVSYLEDKKHPVVHRIITSPHEALAAQINFSTSFGEGQLTNLNGELP